MKSNLIEKFSNKTGRVGIIGLGYVGLPLALLYSDSGFRVLGFDIDASKIQSLLAGKSYIEHISSSSVSAARASGFEVTNDFALTTEVDALILCVPTPLNKYREPDLSYVIGTTEMIAPHLRAGQILSLESTTYPGTTEEELLPRVKSTNLKIGEEIFIVYSPEREDPGNKKYKTQSIPKVIGGISSNCLEVGISLYGAAFDKVIPVTSTKTAEMTKLLENIHRAVNIGLVNEMKIVADRMGIDIHEVIRAASTKPFGFTPYFPGPGLGGHCIPIDPFYLTWKAREYKLSTRFIELAGEINTNMPRWVMDKITEALNDRGKSLSGSKVLVLGIAYKKDVDDMRESPAVELMELLEKKGAVVHYSDPHVPNFPKMRRHSFDLSSIIIKPQVIERYDLLLLVTDHTKFDYDMLQKHAKLIVDTRGVYKDLLHNVIRA
jgi:UDP-N-acetyl-D-glucosamine dehydrogenase